MTLSCSLFSLHLYKCTRYDVILWIDTKHLKVYLNTVIRMTISERQKLCGNMYYRNVTQREKKKRRKIRKRGEDTVWWWCRGEEKEENRRRERKWRAHGAQLFKRPGFCPRSFQFYESGRVSVPLQIARPSQAR